MSFSRLHCHYCGRRSSHARSVREFKCSVCEATNFFDGKGHVIDTPADFTVRTGTNSAAPKRFESFSSQPVSENEQKPVFCRTCIQNQLLYNQALANYLPDDDHPQYREYERGLPKYKAELETRYPQVCKKCAPLAQAQISQADYYGLTQNAAKMVAAHRARRGQPIYGDRDDWGKWAMRTTLNAAGVMTYLGLLMQVFYHLYGAQLSVAGGSLFIDDSELPFDAPTRAYIQRALSLRCDINCYMKLGNIIPSTLVLAACLIWYNPGLKYWYHHTYRIEAVTGQRDYFFIQVIILFVRYLAWRMATDPQWVWSFSKEQFLAVNGFAVAFPCIAQLVANRCISPVKWTIKGKMMPRPDEIDILSASAGPEPEHHTPKASDEDPWRYLRTPDAFDINRLAPAHPRQPSAASTSTLGLEPLSPAASDDDGESMETDFDPILRSSLRSSNKTHVSSHAPNLRPRSVYNHTDTQPLGWSSMRDQLSSIEHQLGGANEPAQRATHPSGSQPHAAARPFDQQPLHRSPFYGHLPPAPMSMERRLRNPAMGQRPQPGAQAAAPLSQQQDFFAQMRRGVKPVQFPEKGSNALQLQPSDWVLPGDVRETGLEDLMGGRSFSLADDPAVTPTKNRVGWLFGWN